TAEYHAKTVCVHMAPSEAYETADGDQAPLFLRCLTVLICLWGSQGVLGRSRPSRTPMTGQRRTPAVEHPLGRLFADVREIIPRDILQVHLRDTVQARCLLPDGSYERLRAQPGDTPLSSQAWLLQHWSSRLVVESSVAM